MTNMWKTSQKNRLIKVSRLSGFIFVSSVYLASASVYAQPFGKGVYGADVPYGDLTSISISMTAAVSMSLSPIGGGKFAGNGSQTVTVTSTDVVGYDLYLNAKTTTSLTKGADTIAASSNLTDAALADNTWGFNTTGSTANFTGIKLTQQSLAGKTGPFKNGDNTTVTFGAKIDSTKISGSYVTDVTYTAVGRT